METLKENEVAIEGTEEKDCNNQTIVNANEDQSHKFLTQKRDRDRETEDKEEEIINDSKANGNQDENAPISQPIIAYPDCEIPLVSFDIFKSLQITQSAFSESELEKSYEAYKETHAKAIAQSFYNEHHEDNWFKEEFNPDVYFELFQEKKKQIHKLSKAFLDNLPVFAQNILLTFDKECFNDGEFSIIETPFIKVGVNEKNRKNKEKEKKKDKFKDSNSELESPLLQFNESLSKYHLLNPNKNTIYLQTIPSFMPIKFILDEINQTEGVMSISIGNPIKRKRYSRYGWATYDSEANCSKGIDKLNEIAFKSFYLYPLKCQTGIKNKKIRTTPPLYPERIAEDRANAKKIIELYAQFNDLNASDLFDLLDSSSLPYSQIIQLDLMILYLRKVFGFCFYCLKDYKDERNSIYLCGFAHLRSPTVIESRDSADKESDIYRNDISFTKSIEEAITKGLNHPFKPMDNSEEVQLEKEKFVCAQIKEIPDGRLQCLICDKQFIGKDFIVKHIGIKHLDSIQENVYLKHSSIRAKEEYMSSQKKEDFYYSELKRTIVEMEEYTKAVSIKNERGFYFKPPNAKKTSYKDYDSLEINNNNNNSHKPKMSTTISYDDL